jgi:hypothetical protein
MPPPLPYFKVDICLFPLPYFASIFFAYLWSFRCPNYIVTLPRYFSLRLPHLNIPTGPPQTNWTRISANVACFIFKSLKQIQPLPVCAGIFICIRNSLDPGVDPGAPHKLEKIWFFCVKSWFFTRNTPKCSPLPSLGAIFLNGPP